MIPRHKILIAPSILSADFSSLQKEVDKVRNADLLHIDVMDGHFVDNITFGPVVIENIKTKLIKDVHLMIEQPEKYVNAFCDAGAGMISFHVDATKKPDAVIDQIRKQGCKVGIALNPDKPVAMIAKYLPKVDYVLIMSVYAGFGGQKFIPAVLGKVRQLRRKYRFSGDIEIDGGINDITVSEVVLAGANLIVAGSFIFKSKNPQQMVELLRHKAEQALK
jgi:ribulose-phosphate 3-epimerase